MKVPVSNVARRDGNQPYEPNEIKRLIFFPSPGHAYNRLFSEALSKYGVLERDGKEFTDRALREIQRRIHGVHFHFVQQLWPQSHLIHQIHGFLGVRRYCRLVKRYGLALIWTVHDLPPCNGTRRLLRNRSLTAARSRMADQHLALVPDERTLGIINSLAFNFFAKNADLIIVHSRSALKRLRSRSNFDCPVVLMPHGNFTELMVPTEAPCATRSTYRLTEGRPVIGMIGRISPSRGHLLALDVAQQMGNEVQLLIAGNRLDPQYAAEIERRATHLPNVVCRIGRLADADYANAVAACDIVLLPYTDVTTSGALLSAWSQGRPVVATNIPLFRELVRPNSDAGMLMRERTVADCISTIRQLLNVPAKDREAAACAESKRYAWDQVVPPVADAMHEILARVDQHRGESVLARNNATADVHLKS